MKKKTLALGTTALIAIGGLLATPAFAQEKTVKIGVLNDRSGLYSDISGEGSAVASRMAVEDFKAKEKGIPHIAETIFDPIHFAFTASVERYAELRRLRPDVEILMAGSVLTVLPVVVLFVALQRHYLRGILAGSLRG